MVLASIFSVATVEACFGGYVSSLFLINILKKVSLQSLEKGQSLKTNATALSRKNFKLSRLKKRGVRLVLQPYPL